MAGYAGLLSFGQQVFIGLGGFAQAMVFYYAPAADLGRLAGRRHRVAAVRLAAVPAAARGRQPSAACGSAWAIAVVLWILYEWLICRAPGGRRVPERLCAAGRDPAADLPGRAAAAAAAGRLLRDRHLADRRVGRSVFNEWRVVGAGGGMQLKSDVTPLQLYYVALVLLMVTTAIIWRWMRSRYGLALTAVRDDEDAARSSGVDVARSRPRVPGQRRDHRACVRPSLHGRGHHHAAFRVCDLLGVVPSCSWWCPAAWAPWPGRSSAAVIFIVVDRIARRSGGAGAAGARRALDPADVGIAARPDGHRA